MKVLSLTEPYATLIKEGKKLVETRSWKTNYRGEIFIHASMTKISKSDLEDSSLMNLVNNVNMSFGNIICSCNLVDCVYMTEEYVKNMKKENKEEYICGDYSVGRYAWILEDVKVLKNPIKAKGQLGIWDYFSVEEVKNLMNDIEYGSIDRVTKLIEYNGGMKNYMLMSPKEVLKYKVGVCWDQVELERFYFNKMDLKFSTYYMCYYDNVMNPTHTFLVYESNNKFYWFENSFFVYRGIHEYQSLEELINDVKSKFQEFYNFKDYLEENLVVYEYGKPKYGISLGEFIDFCENGSKVNFYQV